jgi:hypothetical protein
MLMISCQLQFDWLGGSLAAIMRNDPTAEGLDWTSLQQDLRSRGLLPPGALVAALNWRDAGKIGYALGPNATMLCLSSDSRQFGIADPPRGHAGQDVLLLLVDPAERATEQAKAWFHTLDTLAPSSVQFHGRVLRTITVLRGHKLLLQP